MQAQTEDKNSTALDTIFVDIIGYEFGNSGADT